MLPGVPRWQDGINVKVSNVAPAVSVATPHAISWGNVYSLSGSFTDPGDDSWTGTVDFGDGTGNLSLILNSNRTYSTDHFYAKPGDYTASVVIQDGDGGSGSQSFPVVVVGLPTVNAGQGQTLQEGGIASLAGASVLGGPMCPS